MKMLDATFVCLFSYHFSVVCLPSPAADLSHFSIALLFEPKQGTKPILINKHTCNNKRISQFTTKCRASRS